MQPETFSINLLFFIVIFVAVVAFCMSSRWKKGWEATAASKFMEFQEQ